MKKLSLMICTLEKRQKYFDRLLERLKPQLNDQVEVVACCDDGEASIGAKRNTLVEKATGEYACFIDDDDLVSEDYVAKILAAANGVDCVGIEGVISFDGHDHRKFIHSIRYRMWFERRGIYYRNPNHLNPIKREIILREPFAEINKGEDSDFSKRVLPHLHTESYIEGPIYFYEFREHKEV